MVDQRDVIVQADMAARLRDALAAYGDDDLTLDMIEGETSLFELLDRLMEERANDEAMAEALDAQMKAMKDRQARFKHRADVRKTIVQKAMEHAGLTKIERPAFTASIKNSPAKVTITDESALPENMLRVKRTPNLIAIKKALQDGEPVMGALMSNGGQTIQVRTK